MRRGGKRRPSGRDGLWQGGLGWDKQRGLGGWNGTGHNGTRRAGSAWVVRDGEKRNRMGDAGQDIAQRNKAGGASGVGRAGQTASGWGEAAT